MVPLVLRPGSCLSSPQAAAKCMLSTFKDKRHQEARHALAKGDVDRAAHLAEKGNTSWSRYVLACCEWQRRRWMRVVGHTTAGTRFGPEGDVERHYQALLQKIEGEFASNVPNFLRSAPAQPLSACLIVRDEEAVLERCLASLKHTVDEIIVVDTGSVDRSVEIAQSFKANVSEFEWVDDFAAARNAALERATGDWVLSIDADEWLAESSRHVVKVCMTDPSCFFIPLIVGTNGVRTFGNTRLFPRPHARWTGALHEDIDLAPHGLMGVQVSALMFNHEGYTDEIMESKDKAARNQRLIEQMLSRGGEEAWLGRTYDALNSSVFEPDAIAIEKLFRLVEEDPKPSRLKRVTYRVLASKLMAAGRYQDAIRVAELAEERGFHGLWSFHLAARIAYAAGEKELAAGLASKGLSMRDEEGAVELLRTELVAIRSGTL